MRYGKASQIGVAIRKTRDTTDMIDTVDGWADLVSLVELDMLCLPWPMYLHDGQVPIRFDPICEIDEAEWDHPVLDRRRVGVEGEDLQLD